mmetsp:Transcript_26050/g.46219  ORF Transcript_26050/g.46219 Transcript_26050/m.46219 type:complete len:353 (+) Transcript_26050:353-1411(+)
MLVLDHGASLLRFGSPDSTPKTAHNCVTKSKCTPFVFAPSSLVGLSEVYRPMQQGVLVNVELERKIWQRVFKGTDCSETDLLLALPPFTPTSVLQSVDQMVFEDFKFRSYRRVHSYLVETGLHLDLGFSGCTVLPSFNGKLLNYAVQRIGVGGKLLTNFMKEKISFRNFDMTDETWLVDHIKQSACYISLDFERELSEYQTDRRRACRYALPDRDDYGRLAGRDEESGQTLTLDNLRIAVPELLFKPSDVGLPQAGLAEAMVYCVERTPALIAQDLLSNIVISGGSAGFPNLKERLDLELQALLPQHTQFKTTLASEYFNSARSTIIGSSLASELRRPSFPSAITQSVEGTT